MRDKMSGSQNSRIQVQWFGSHPLEGSVSMNVYRDQLWDAREDSDSIAISCWPEAGKKISKASRLIKAKGKYLDYPLRVRNDEGADIVHFLDHSSGYLIPQVSKNKKIVATLHDLIPLRFSTDLSTGQVARFRKSVSHLLKCDALISVSQYSKREAIELLGFPEDRIHVVPNGVKVPRDLVGGCEYVQRLRREGGEVVVLSVGSAQDRKNLDILPKAFESLEQKTGLKAALLRVGAPLKSTLATKLRSVCGDQFFLEAGRLSEELLWKSYGDCDIVIVPSLYEGFGLPVIEALACGKGVAASNRSSLPEVGGSLVEYFEPESGEDAGEAMAKLALERDDEVRANQRRRAVGGLTWRRHLEGVFEVYRLIFEG